MSESRKLLDEIAQRHDSLRALLERRVSELRNQKTDRALLSALFAEIASQISEDSAEGKAHTPHAETVHVG